MTVDEIKMTGVAIFKTKKEMLDYIKKYNFDEHIVYIIKRKGKWVVEVMQWNH